MASTKYEIKVGNDVVDSRSAKNSAISRAVEVATETGNEVQVVTAAGTVVETVQAPVSRRRAPNYTRIENAEFAPARKGYTIAYTRPRIKTAVYRRNTGPKNDETYYLVLNTATGEESFARDTVEAREITNEIAAKRLAAKREPAAA